MISHMLLRAQVKEKDIGRTMSTTLGKTKKAGRKIHTCLTPSGRKLATKTDKTSTGHVSFQYPLFACSSNMRVEKLWGRMCQFFAGSDGPS